MKQFLMLHIQKTFCSFPFFILIVTAMLLSCASVYFVQDNSVFLENPDLLETFQQGQYYNLGVLQIPSIDMLSAPQWNPLLLCILNSMSMAVLLSTGIVLNITKEFQYGSFFSAVAKGYSRLTIYFSYVITMLMLTLVISVVYLFGFMLSAMGSGMPAGNMDSTLLLHVLSAQIFMLAGYSVFCTTLAILLRNTVTSVLTVIMISSALPPIFSYIRIVYRISFDFESCWVLSRLCQLSGRSPDRNDFLSALMLAGISILIGMGWINQIRIRNE